MNNVAEYYESNKLAEYLKKLEEGEPANFLISGPAFSKEFACLNMPMVNADINDARMLARQYASRIKGVCLFVRTEDWGGVQIEI